MLRFRCIIVPDHPGVSARMQRIDEPTDLLGSAHPDRRPRIALRAATFLFLVAGALTLVSALTAGAAANPLGLLLVAIGASLVGALTIVLPWHRWSPRASLALIPAALTLIAFGNAFGPRQALDYAVYFAVLHAWIGLAHPPRTSLFVAPLTAIAFAAPLASMGVEPAQAWASGIVVVPVSVLLGETIAYVIQRLDRAEHDRAELASAIGGQANALAQLRDAQQQLEFLAYHDPLTGLPNRTFLEEHLHLMLARARRGTEAIALCALDLDRFKLVNDTAGHTGGDEFLREVARRLHVSLREGDIVARVGGDEFLLVLALPPDEDPAAWRVAANHLRDRVIEALERPFVIAGMEFQMSASTGLSLFPEDGRDPATLMRRADAAMYREKWRRAGTVSWVGDGEDAEDIAPMSARLENAAKHGDWSLVFQPVVELVLGRTIGAEALLRWPDPVYGAIGPGGFIPVAEELGLMPTIGAWVVDELARRCERWRRDGVLDGIRMLSFNVSPRELWNPGFVERLAAVAHTFARPGLLVAEITESALAMDPGRADDVLRELRAHGIRIALDDFGSGYSSLARLRGLAIDVLKIDREFLLDVEDDPTARSIVRSVLQLCQALGVVSLAEGIEREGQVDFLLQHGCLLGQGFLFGQPEPPDAVTHRLREAERVENDLLRQLDPRVQL
jgi:diguanylate cyclase (GGDEF)-like protein